MSMLCPICQGKAGCIESRLRMAGHVARRYECKCCGYRFSTREELMAEARDGVALRGKPFTGKRGDPHAR